MIIAGHSMGGALANIAAIALAINDPLDILNSEFYTFGAPRVGDEKAYNIIN